MAVERPRRVRVVLADRRPAPAPVPPEDEVREQTEVGRLLVRGLMRAQLALALRLAAIAVLGVGTWPALFAVVPGLAEMRWLGVPLPWWVLGVAVPLVVLVVARVFLRQAVRNEDEFTALLRR
ncbi:hypothetical protein GIS00_01860 [Nakamurella sp. YIM 132087]|uniref:DUF485 domain-containing protein n=1 Tax=Nakamurella alba TaxID=2665158 RepID=A0A7K1FF03_9ACTN|nr:hypothetical protein [Nakamurella alba]MTD12691.1 hypothetical protein [Nakamurella alba]